MSSQFLVDSIVLGGDENLIRGICGLGSISVGQAFSRATSDRGDVKFLNVVIEKIITYRHEVDELPKGMTGELHAVGDISLLEHGDMLEF